MIKFIMLTISIISSIWFPLNARPSVTHVTHYADPLDDPKLSVAAKALWIAIMSQKPLEDADVYFENLDEHDVFYQALCELKRKGYL